MPVRKSMFGPAAFASVATARRFEYFRVQFRLRKSVRAGAIVGRVGSALILPVKTGAHCRSKLRRVQEIRRPGIYADHALSEAFALIYQVDCDHYLPARCLR